MAAAIVGSLFGPAIGALATAIGRLAAFSVSSSRRSPCWRRPRACRRARRLEPGRRASHRGAADPARRGRRLARGTSRRRLRGADGARPAASHRFGAGAARSRSPSSSPPRSSRDRSGDRAPLRPAWSPAAAAARLAVTAAAGLLRPAGFGGGAGAAGHSDHRRVRRLLGAGDGDAVRGGRGARARSRPGGGADEHRLGRRPDHRLRCGRRRRQSRGRHPSNGDLGRALPRDARRDQPRSVLRS